MGQVKTGSLAGAVKDVETHEPLAGANVFLRGTFLGNVSDIHGKFLIRNVPAGVYTVNVTLVGYRSQSREGVAIAEDADERIEVFLQQAPILKEQVVVTASRYEQNIQDVPVSIATVSAEEVAERISITLDDALRYVPGVNMMQDQVNIRGSTGYSRGVGSRVLVLFDGLPYMTGDTGEITWETLPMNQIERIEVVKGAGSALYGSNALGGVINVITREIPSDDEIAWRLYSGLYDTPRHGQWVWSDKPRFNSGGHVSVSRSSGPMSFLGSISRSVDESYRENDVYHRWSAFAKLKYFLSPTQNIFLMGNLMQRSHGNFFWWKNLSEATRPATSQLNGNVDSKRGNVSFAYKEFVSQGFFYTVKAIYFGNFWRDDSAGRVNNVSASHVLFGEVQGTIQLSPWNILTLGGGANYDQVSSNIFGDHPGTGRALYVQDELKVMEEWKLSFGMRYDWQRVSALPAASQLSPKIGVVFAPDNATTVRASFGQGFRYPSISELNTELSTGISAIRIVPNQNLQAERSTSYEVGVMHVLTDAMMIEAAIYQNDYRRLIEPSVKVTKRVDGSDSVFIQFDNVTQARIRGIEVGLRCEILDRMFSAHMSYAFNDPQDLSDPGRTDVLKFRPRHLAYGSFQFRYDHMGAGIDFRYISRVERIDELLVRFAPIVNGNQRVPIRVADARFSYDFLGVGLPLRIGFNVKNVLNYHYVELIGNLAPVRTYLMAVEGIF
ncbi:MAG: TonB-dependent receptor [Ignavibacteriales bacterium]|nr:TonB-dependent receptor [Ignavibacteriales bacterium]